jgi:hypothetical protein
MEGAMLGFIVTIVIVGLLARAVACLLVPSKQGISSAMAPSSCC